MSNQDGTKTTAEQYIPGEIVRVTFEGRVSVAASSVPVLLYCGDAEEPTLIPMNATVERVMPADGEPQAGDIWRDGRGREWLCFNGYHMIETTERALPDGHEEPFTWQQILNLGQGPMTLVYRRDDEPAEPMRGER